VRQDFWAIGELAIKGLLGQLEQGEPMVGDLIGLQLIIRESTAHVRTTQ
jgi:DNA-binding LacI/PurR family transcriptional regulator